MNEWLIDLIEAADTISEMKKRKDFWGRQKVALVSFSDIIIKGIIQPTEKKPTR